VHYLIHALGVFSDGRGTSEEPAVRETTLLDTGWSKLTELALEVHFLTWVDFLWSPESLDTILVLRSSVSLRISFFGV